MKREVELSILDELLRQLDEKKNVDAGVMYRNPTSAYTCKDVARREQEVFFRDHPQLIGLSGSIKEPGSFMTVEDFGVPVLATRAADGQFRAFVNACRHRGARLLEGSGRCERAIVCPYHGWTYDLQGGLIATPFWDGTPGSKSIPVDPCKNSLVPVRCQVWNHVVFVNLEGTAPDLLN